jgi:cytochrome c553
MAGLVPATHVFLSASPKQDVGARHKAGHDEKEKIVRQSNRAAEVRLHLLDSTGISKMKILMAAALLVFSATSVTQAQQAGKKTTASGVFTAEQAKSGERAFQARCASCHGADLHSTEPEAPDLTEGAFKFGWEGKTIANRFEAIRGTMPYGNARSLDDQTYIDIVAYILAFNGIPSGNQKLAPDVPALEQIVIAVPAG